jgi:class 3 adenylate cyclase
LPYTLAGFDISFWWSAFAAPVMFLAIFAFSADILGLLPTLAKAKTGSFKALSLLALPVMNIACIASIFIFDDPAILGPIRGSALAQIIVLVGISLNLWIKSKRKNIVSIVYAISWAPLLAATFVVVAWLSGALAYNDIYSWGSPIAGVAQSLLLSFAAGQKLNLITRDKLHEQQEKLRVMHQLEIQVDNLQRRDRVITTFVSQEIVNELDKGHDPLAYTPRNTEKSIVFLDMHNFTSFSEARLPIECYDVLNSYFELINKVTYAGGGKVEKIIGDAMMLAFDDPQRCLTSIVELRKKLSIMNRDRVASSALPIKFGMGISHGLMLSANFGSTHKLDRTYVGDSVNTASRLETITRQFAVDVLCSREFIELNSGYKYIRPAGYVLLKGKQKKSLVYEVFEHNTPNVVEWKLSTIPHVLQAIELELRGSYIEAVNIILELIKKCPKHTYKAGMIMDQTLEIMVISVEEKMKQLGLPVPQGGFLADLNKLKKVS